MALIGNEIGDRDEHGGAIMLKRLCRGSLNGESRNINTVIDQGDALKRTALISDELTHHALRITKNCRHAPVQPSLASAQEPALLLIAVEAAPAHHTDRHASREREWGADQIGGWKEEMDDLRPPPNHDPKEFRSEERRVGKEGRTR